MEKRFGTVFILIEDKNSISKINDIITKHCDIIIGRQGIPILHRGISIISLVLEGTTNEISSLTGQAGRINGVQLKSILLKVYSL